MSDPVDPQAYWVRILSLYNRHRLEDEFGPLERFELKADDQSVYEPDYVDRIYTKLGLNGEVQKGQGLNVNREILFIAMTCNYMNKFAAKLNDGTLWRTWNVEAKRNMYKTLNTAQQKQLVSWQNYVLPKPVYLHSAFRLMCSGQTSSCLAHLNKDTCFGKFTPVELYEEYAVYFARRYADVVFVPTDPVPAWLHEAMGDPVPAAPEVTDNYFNIFDGFEIVPERGNDIAETMLMLRDQTTDDDGTITNEMPIELSHILQVIYNVFCDRNDSQYRQFLCWMAHVVKRPWEKPVVSPILKGLPGGGKTRFVEMLGRIMGANLFVEDVGTKNFLGRFNAIFSNRKLVLIDEVDWKKDGERLQELKGRQTAEFNTYEKKFRDSETHRDYSATVFVTNLQATPGEWEARRFMPLLVSLARMLDDGEPLTYEARKQLGKQVYAWLSDPKGIRQFAALLYAFPPHLLADWRMGHGLDPQDFKLLMDGEKQQLARNSSVYRWHRECVYNKSLCHNCPPGDVRIQVDDPANGAVVVAPSDIGWVNEVLVHDAYLWYRKFTSIADQRLTEESFVAELELFLTIKIKRKDKYVYFGETREKATENLKNFMDVRGKQNNESSGYAVVLKWFDRTRIESDTVTVYVDRKPYRVSRDVFDVETFLRRIELHHVDINNWTVEYTCDHHSLRPDACVWVPFTIDVLTQPGVDEISIRTIEDEFHEQFGTQQMLEMEIP